MAAQSRRYNCLRPEGLSYNYYFSVCDEAEERV